MLSREREKLEKALGGIKDTCGRRARPVFVIDTNKEALAIKQANRLKIPVIAILDTNSDPDGITFLIPANDDASRAILLYCDLRRRAAIDGILRAAKARRASTSAKRRPLIATALQSAGGGCFRRDRRWREWRFQSDRFLSCSLELR